MIEGVLAISEDKFLKAAKNGQVDAMREALKQGVDVNVKDDNGWTALMLAIFWSGNMDVVKELLKQGADINAKDREGVTAMIIAIDEERAEIARLLKENGAGTQRSAVLQNAEVARLLKENGADTQQSAVLQNEVLQISNDENTDVVEILKATWGKK